MKKIITMFTVLTLTIVLAACSSEASSQSESQSESDNDKQNLVVTTTFINDMVSVLDEGIDGYNVEMIIPAGEDPHVYEPKASDLKVLGDADTVLYHGLNFEGRMTDVLEEGVSIAEDFNTDHLTTMEDDEGGSETDPHFWFDIELYKQAITKVKDTLIENNPEAEDAYEENYQAYIEELDELETYLADRIEEIPEESRILVTPHDAFQYLEQTQDIEVHAPQGFSTDSEVSNNQIEETANLIADNNIKAIFVETTTNPDRMTRLQEIVESKGGSVEVVNSEDEKLLSDSLAVEGEAGDTFIGMYRHNIDTIVDNLK